MHVCHFSENSSEKKADFLALMETFYNIKLGVDVGQGDNCFVVRLPSENQNDNAEEMTKQSKKNNNLKVVITDEQNNGEPYYIQMSEEQYKALVWFISEFEIDISIVPIDELYYRDLTKC